MNIEIFIEAMAEEKSYIEDRMQGRDSSLPDRLKAYGYEELSEYFDDKRDYLFSQIKFNFVEVPMPNGVSEIFKMIEANKPGVLFVDWEDTYVVCGNKGLEEFNQEYCEANGITFFPLYTGGGTIVGSKGDFSFGVCYPKNILIDSNYILNCVRNILQCNTSLDVSVSGNDILLGGKKICGSATYTKADVSMTIMHFSFNDWSELISNICTTSKQGKEVAYVNFMSRADFKAGVLEWLQKNLY